MIEDGEKIDRIPKIHGLLAFRQDSESLYIRKNKSWKLIAEDEKVGDLNDTKIVYTHPRSIKKSRILVDSQP